MDYLHYTRNGPARAFLLTFLALCCLPAFAQEPPVTEAERNPAQVLLFHQHAEDYKGGKQVAVTVYISALQWDGLNAMGLYETVPEGWTYAGARAIAGTMPGVTPKSGDTGVLQFLWIEQSTAPITFQYLLNVPPRESGTRYFSGQVEYRLGEGALTSNVDFSQLTGVADALPVITLRGESSVTLSLNGTFSDPGASATDVEDGDLSAQIEVAGTVDTATPGDYALVYGVLDSVGNRAAPVTRQVTVSENSAEPGSPTPGGEQPDTPGTIALDGPTRGPGMPRMASNVPEGTAKFPPITIPDVTLHKNGENVGLPLKPGGAGEAGSDGEASTAKESAADHAFRVTQATDRARSAEENGIDAAPGPPGGAEDATAAAQSPVVLLGVALLMGAALMVLWRQSRHPARRARLPKT